MGTTGNFLTAFFPPGHEPSDETCAAVPALLQAAVRWRTRTLLVRGTVGFYNPSNTALESVVSFLRIAGVQPPSRRVVCFRKQCLNIHSTYVSPRSNE